MSVYRVGAAAAAAALALATLSVTSATATQDSTGGPSPNAMVNAVPSAKTPAVNNGDVRAIAKVGTTMVIGGNFSQVNSLTRNHIASFDQATGTLSAWDPNVNGSVLSLVPGPNGHSVFIAGQFTQVGSTTVKNLALVDINTGAVDPSFATPLINPGKINDIVLQGNRLYVAGDFTKVGGQNRGGLASLNATTGALDSFLKVSVTGHHNDTGSGAQGSIGPWAIDVTPDGTRMVAIGNFKYADGLLRDQVVQINLTGASASVRPDWATSRYAPYCFSWAFDSYVRGVSFSPDGSYFVINATGGGVTGTLCDATTRWETNATGSDVQPTWIDETGGDTVWAVTITDSAVFSGGHQRWANNPLGSDYAAPGAVPRPGLAAYDPISGRPLQWNPGRNPEGTAVYAMLATAEGLYMGSNTDYVGNRLYKRQKIAFFPYAGGVDLASTQTGTLPGTVYLGGSPPPLDLDNLQTVAFTGSSASPAQPVNNGGIAWSQVRGAFMVGNRVFYGYSDGFIYYRTFNGTTFGPAVQINAYHDPLWKDVDNNLGGTYDGNNPTLYGQLPNVTGMVYSGGRLYYTLSGDSTLRSRWFSPDSGIVDETNVAAPSSVNFSDAGGMFVHNGTLYYVTKADGNLNQVAFSGGAVTGSSTVVSGPGIDGVDWRSRGLFLYSGPAANQPPTAAFTSSCDGGGCTFDGSGSSDSDGTVASYAWNFGDSSTGTGVNPAHTFTSTGTFTVQLTVTDDGGATASTSHNITVSPVSNGLSYVGSSHSAPGATKFKQAVVPASAQAGDMMLLFFTTNASAVWTGPTGLTGWTQVDTFTNATTKSTVWTRPVGAGDAGVNVRFDSTVNNKGVVNLAVYRGVDTAQPIEIQAHRGDFSTSSHTTATLFAEPGDWVVSYWGDKSDVNTTWTAPGGTATRDMAIDNGAGRFNSLLVDSGGTVLGGTYGALTATTDGTSGRTNMHTIALNPA